MEESYRDPDAWELLEYLVDVDMLAAMGGKFSIVVRPGFKPDPYLRIEATMLSVRMVRKLVKAGPPDRVDFDLNYVPMSEQPARRKDGWCRFLEDGGYLPATRDAGTGWRGAYRITAAAPGAKLDSPDTWRPYAKRQPHPDDKRIGD